MKHLPKLDASLVALAISLILAPLSFGQTTVWLQEDLAPTFDRVKAMASDSAGNVFQAVDASPSPFMGIYDVRLSRRNAEGDLIWMEGLRIGDDVVPEALASDGIDGVFMTGYTLGDLGGPQVGQGDAWLAHYDAQGQRTWIRQFGTGMFDAAEAAAPDGAGGVFVAGRSFGSHGGPQVGLGDIWLARYGSAGNQLWISQFGTVLAERVVSVTLDSGGGVVLCGQVFGDLAANQAGLGDAFVARFDSAGAMTWSSQFGSPQPDLAQAVVSDSAGGVFVTGVTHGAVTGLSAGGRDVWLAHYNAAGVQTWLRQFGSAVEDRCTTAVPDATGGFFVAGISIGDIGAGGSSAGPSWLGHFDASGTAIWIDQFGAADYNLVVAGAPNQRGGVYLGGYLMTQGPASVWIGRFDNINTETYCSPAFFNSTGTDGKMSATGSGDIAANDVVLRADDLPPHSFGYFITSQLRDNFIPLGGSGVICVGSPTGRFIGPGQVQNSGGAGSFSTPIDLTAIALPSGPTAVQPGESWHFQAWHRDSIPSITSWNLTDGLTVIFR